MTESRVTQTLGREQRGTPGPRTPMPDLRSDAVSPELRQGQRLASRGTPAQARARLPAWLPTEGHASMTHANADP